MDASRQPLQENRDRPVVVDLDLHIGAEFPRFHRQPAGSKLGQEAMVMEAIEAGAVDFIVKPPRAEDVLAVVKKVLGEA